MVRWSQPTNLVWPIGISGYCVSKSRQLVRKNKIYAWWMRLSFEYQQTCCWSSQTWGFFFCVLINAPFNIGLTPSSNLSRAEAVPNDLDSPKKIERSGVNRSKKLYYRDGAAKTSLRSFAPKLVTALPIPFHRNYKKMLLPYPRPNRTAPDYSKILVFYRPGPGWDAQEVDFYLVDQLGFAENIRWEEGGGYYTCDANVVAEDEAAGGGDEAGHHDAGRHAAAVVPRRLCPCRHCAGSRARSTSRPLACCLPAQLLAHHRPLLHA